MDGDYIDKIVTALGLESKLTNLPTVIGGQRESSYCKSTATKPHYSCGMSYGQLRQQNKSDVFGPLKVMGEKFRQPLL